MQRAKPSICEQITKPNGEKSNKSQDKHLIWINILTFGDKLDIPVKSRYTVARNELVRAKRILPNILQAKPHSIGFMIRTEMELLVCLPRKSRPRRLREAGAIIKNKF